MDNARVCVLHWKYGRSDKDERQMQTLPLQQKAGGKIGCVDVLNLPTSNLPTLCCKCSIGCTGCPHIKCIPAILETRVRRLKCDLDNDVEVLWGGMTLFLQLGKR